YLHRNGLAWRWRDSVADQWHGSVEEHPVWFTVGGPSDLTADRRLGFGRDARLIQRHLVRPAGEAVQARQEHRVIRHRLGQQDLVGIAIGPRALVPAATDDPLALRHAPGTFRDPRDRFLFRLDVDQVDEVERSAESEYVRVRVD